MARLSQHVNINEKVLKLLEHKNIFTILDFLDEDPNKLCSVSGLSFKDIIDVRRNILLKFSVKPISGLEIYSNMLIKAAKLSTGIDCLDKMLEGGFLTGNICEICGLSGDGKTQLCFKIASHVAVNLKQTVYFIDTKHDFSASRMQNIIKAQHCNEKETELALEKIKVSKVEDVYKMINFLYEIEKVLIDDPCRIVIIDSLPVLFVPFISGNNSDGFGLMNCVAATMKYIAAKFQIVFLVVNLAMFSFDIEDNEGQNKTSTVGGSTVTFMGDLKPALGKAWLQAPSYRLLIQKDSLLQDSQRNIILVKSTDLPSGRKCVVELCNSDIVSVTR